MVTNKSIEGKLTNRDFILDSWNFTVESDGSVSQEDIAQTSVRADEFELDITGASGQDLTISLSSPDNGFDPFLQVLDPITGRVKAFDDNSGEENNALIDSNLKVPNNGKLTIRVTYRLTDDNPDLANRENLYNLDVSVPSNNADIELKSKNAKLDNSIEGTSETINSRLVNIVTIDGELDTDDFNFTRTDEFNSTINDYFDLLPLETEDSEDSDEPGLFTRVDEYQIETTDDEQYITIKLTKESGEDRDFDPFLQVIDADTGEVVADSDNYGGLKNASIQQGNLDDNFNEIPGELNIKNDDDYIIRVTSVDNFAQSNQDKAVDYKLEVSVAEGEVTVTPRIPKTIVAEDTTVDDSDDALELTGGKAQIAYVAYYGRPADIGGLAFWNDVLTNSGISYAPQKGDRLTGNEQDVYNQIVNQFGNSAEADRLFGDSSNRDKLNQVYQFVFDRDGDEGGLDFWEEQIDLGNVTLATFALEVALGAQNDDINVLNNKIASADLFSNSIDIEAEIEAYSGSSGEVFGRDWLAGFDDTVSTQAQVNSALDDLIG